MIKLGPIDLLHFLVHEIKQIKQICRSCQRIMKLRMVGFSIFTVRKRSYGEVMFYSCLSVILFTGGCLPQCMLGYTPPSRHLPGQTPPRQTPLDRHPLGRHRSRADTPHADTPLPSRRPLQWTVPILLECFLV